MYDEDEQYDNALADEERKPPRRRQKIAKPPLVTPGKPPPPPMSPSTDGDLTIPPGTRVQDVNWRSIMQDLKEHETKSFAFTVNAQQFEGGHVWEIKMRLERALCIHEMARCTFLLIEPVGAPTVARRCVSIRLADDDIQDDLFFEIVSLFYDVPAGDYTRSCRHEMLRSEDWDDPNAHLGQGAVILELADSLAPLLDTYMVHLTDAARFAPDSERGNPDIFSSDLYMTYALAMLRGYGYYEGRGFYSDYLIKAALSNNGFSRPELSNPQRIIDHAHADFLWTETTMSTPTKDLYEAIVNFPKTLAEQWSNWSPYSFEEGLSEQFKRHLYSSEACKKHADRAQLYVDEMLSWCKGDKIGDSDVDRDRLFGKWMDEFDELSIRDIRKNTMEKLARMENARAFMYRYDSVPEEHERIKELIEVFMQQVWHRRIYENSTWNFLEYPGDLLEKIIFKGPGGRHRSLKIVVDDTTKSPKVVLRNTRVDFTCETSTSVVSRTPRVTS